MDTLSTAYCSTSARKHKKGMLACWFSIPWWTIKCSEQSRGCMHVDPVCRDALNSLAQSRPEGPSFNKISHILSLNAILLTWQHGRMLALRSSQSFHLKFDIHSSHHPGRPVWLPFCILGWKDNFKWYHRHSEGRSHHFHAGNKAILAAVVKSGLRREVRCI